MRRGTQSVIAVIVLLGVVLIPSFFAWFNVLSSWDPFGNVKNLKVAVANADEGYESDLFPMRINIGEQVIANLRANSDLNWVFTSAEDAIEGTESEEYYAALVLPPDFSREMMTFLSPGAKPAQIEYYTNEKKNAISPKITGEAATEVSTKINESFTKTLNEVGLATILSLSEHLEDADAQGILGQLSGSANQLATELRASADTAEMFSAVAKSSETLVGSAASLAQSSSDAMHETAGAISGGAGAAADLRRTLAAATQQLSAAFSASSNSYSQLANDVNALYNSLDSGAQTAEDAMSDIRGDVQGHRDRLIDTRDLLQTLPPSPELDAVIAALDAAIDRQDALLNGIDRAIQKVETGREDAQADRQEILGLVNSAKSAIDGVVHSYDSSLRPKLDQLAGTLSSVSGGVHQIGSDLSDVVALLSVGSGSLVGAIDQTVSTTDGLAASLGEAADEMEQLAAALEQAAESGDLTSIIDLIGPSSDRLAGELTTPVGLKQIDVFKVDTFGAQMAPFYTVLGLWIGSLLLAVLIRSDVPKFAMPVTETPLTLGQQYIGHYGIFGVLAFLQSTLLYTGLIGFVGVIPAHPFLLILVGWVMSFVFSIIAYTMVLSLGEAGKALVVFLLVVQISAGGGAYPLAVLPQWFQNISPFLPVTHAIDAVRSAIAGIYAGDYWISLGWLLVFILPMLVLGLVLRVPLIKVNKDLEKATDSTKLM